MGRPEIAIPEVHFMYGGDLAMLCGECQLPCKLSVTSVDCMRRFFLQSLLQCTYFVYGYCFLMDEPGCVLDNGGSHEIYWMNLLNDYFHNVRNVEESDPEFVRRSDELKGLVFEQIENRRVSLCRYFEEIYTRIMETGGGLSEQMMEKLDEAYLALLSGTSRKR
jgi:hypothetical protein